MVVAFQIGYSVVSTFKKKLVVRIVFHLRRESNRSSIHILRRASYGRQLNEATCAGKFPG
jgi:hypothetical protein